MNEDLLVLIIDEIESSFDGYDTCSEINHKDIVESSKNAGNAILAIIEKRNTRNVWENRLKQLDEKIKILTEKHKILIEALDFYGDEKLYYQSSVSIDMNQTTAILKEKYRHSHDITKPNIVTSIEYECSAKIKVDQGKRAREAKERCK